MMWRPTPLEFEGSQPSKANVPRRSRRKAVTSPVEPKVKSCQQSNQQWVSPQFNDVISLPNTKQKNRRRQRPIKRVVPELSQNHTSHTQEEDQEHHRSTVSSKQKKQKKLEFVMIKKRPIEPLEESNSLQSVNSSHDDSMPPSYPHHNDHTPSLASIDPTRMTSSNDHSPFNPNQHSTPYNPNKSLIHNSIPSIAQISSTPDQYSGCHSNSVLANDTPSSMYDCGIKCTQQCCTHNKHQTTNY